MSKVKEKFKEKLKNVWKTLAKISMRSNGYLRKIWRRVQIFTSNKQNKFPPKFYQFFSNFFKSS